MHPSDPHRFSDDLQPVVDFLREHRPEATALELDTVRRQVHTRVRKGPTSMKSRIAMMAMVVFGLLLSGTGAGLAVSGSDATENASQAQYPPNTQTLPCDRDGNGIVDGNEDLNGDAPGCEDSGTLPTTTSGDTSCDENGDGVISPTEAAKHGCGGVKAETEESAPVTQREQAAQPTRQVAASGGDELPFTGFAAIPILVVGMALLAGGLVLRRRTSA